jgi:ABC-2 type transport system permease protein
MNTMGWLVKREYWEHRGGFLWAPVWVSVVMLALTLVGIISAEVVGSRVEVSGGVPWDRIAERLNAGDIAHAGAGLDGAFVALAAILCIPLFFVLFFYLLGSLYDDRRDRSVLFWKSLPVTDTATVLSKVIAAVLLAPIIAFVVAIAAYVVLLLIVCGWAALHGINPLPAIASSHPLGLLWRLALTIPVDALWALPTVGWLMFWSAFARSKPFLWAVLVPIFVVIANSWLGMLGAPSLSRSFLVNDVVFRLLFGIVPGAWLQGTGLDLGDRIRGVNSDGEVSTVLAIFDPSVVYALLGTPKLWIGVVVGAALIAASVWLRRTRIETST